MSEENVEIVRRDIQAFNGRDLTEQLSMWSRGAEIDWSRSLGPLKGVYRGHPGLKAFWDEFWSSFETVEIETHDFIPAGIFVVVPNTAHLRGREGIEVSAKSTFVYTVESGEITSLRLFQEQAEALEAAGLSG
jgi:ketosteroid isomerase-like protein